MSETHPYPQYVPTGVNWLDEIPASWVISPLKRQLTRNNGGVWGEDPSGVNDTYVLRSTDQTVDGHWKVSEPAIRSLSPVEKSRFHLLADDLVVTKSSGSADHIGKTSLVTPEIEEMGAAYSNFMQRLRVTSQCHPKFFWYVMRSREVRQQINLQSTTTTGLANLTGTVLGNLSVAIPPPSDQEGIVVFLDREVAKIDNFIADQEELIDLINERRAASILTTVTTGTYHDVPMAHSGYQLLGKIPAHWTVTRMKAAVRKKKQIVGNRWSDHLLLSLTLNGVIPRDLENIVGKMPSDFTTYQAVNRDDIIFCLFDVEETPRTVGRAPEPGMVTGAYTVTEVRDGFLPEFVAYHYLAFDQYKSYKGYYAGLRNTIRYSDFSNIPFLRPPKAEQQAIVERLNHETKEVNAAISDAQKSIALSKERRAALISAAVTGKIDVRNWQKSTEKVLESHGVA
ncbi:restriction endonuclease subunit S [Kocuria rosea]|uniref:restriction endonuclease subunit S n=1 Tax=Kocuria rosea TaxID=1275 RepID=UPI000B3088D8|nr:restriction endonuclease subunit S [Kocuria polaris]